MLHWSSLLVLTLASFGEPCIVLKPYLTLEYRIFDRFSAAESIFTAGFECLLLKCNSYMNTLITVISNYTDQLLN